MCMYIFILLCVCNDSCFYICIDIYNDNFFAYNNDYSQQNFLNFAYILKNNFSNLTDAVYAVIGANYKNYYGGVSYDFNISQLNTASNYRGALEISFIYTGISTRLTKIQIPCDRY